MKKIFTLTLNPTVDASCVAEHISALQKIRTHDEHFHPGGGGINTARMIHRLGGFVKAIYPSGGVMGAALNHLLDEKGILKIVIPIAGKTRIGNVIYEQATGTEYRFIAEGDALSEAEWRACVQACENQKWDWLVVSGSLPRGVPLTIYDELIEMAQKRGKDIAIDTSGEALSYVMERGGASLIKPNEDELKEYTGKDCETLEEAAAIVKELVDAGVSKMIAATLGVSGAVIATKDGVFSAPSYGVKAVSASGAGDSFLGGIIYAFSKRLDIEKALSLGIACGAATVMEAGTNLGKIGNIRRIYNQIEPSALPGDIQQDEND